MKTKLRIISLFLLIAVALSGLVGCSGETVSDEGTASIVVENRDGSFSLYEADLSLLESYDRGALSVLEYLGKKKDGITYSVSFGGGYGGYVNSIGSLSPAGNEYVAIYTTEACDFAVATEYMPTVSTAEYNGRTLTYSGVGVSEMAVKDKTVILFRIESF